LTLVGVPCYSAPDMILGESYGMAADYWSVGVMLYELLIGGLPFGDLSSNPLEIYEMVIHEELSFPSYFTDKTYIDIITHFLQKDPKNR
jgi:serine/threonine protein kinase